MTPVMHAVGGDHTVFIDWSPIVGAAKYRIWYRTAPNAAWLLAATFNAPQSNSALNLPGYATFQFAVTAIDANGNSSAMSAPDLATTVPFTDPTIAAGVTPVKALHINELRTAIDAVRAFAGLTAFSYSTTVAAGHPISTTDIAEMRTALSQARNAIGSPVSFTDPSLTSTSPIRAIHINELRAGTD
jgi:hypothetical protein